MKRFRALLFLAGGLVPLASAQGEEHVQMGVFADDLRLDQTSSNFGGVGAWAGFQLYKELKIEGEMSYDFHQTFTEGFTDPSTGSITFVRTNVRTLHGEFGPRLNIGHLDSTVRFREGRIHQFQDRQSAGNRWYLHQQRRQFALKRCEPGLVSRWRLAGSSGADRVAARRWRRDLFQQWVAP